MIKKILIIGGYGFLGFNLAKKLSNNKYKIFLLCKTRKKKKVLKNVSYIYCDICDYDQLKKKLTGEFDYVFNFSGNIDHKNKEETILTHFHGLKNIIKILKKKNIEVFFQSGSCLSMEIINLHKKKRKLVYHYLTMEKQNIMLQNF